MRLYLCLATLAVVLNVTPGSARAPDSTDAPILATIHAFSEARTKFDAAKLSGLLTPDYTRSRPAAKSTDGRQC